jgi:hypothetical protein
MRIVSWIAYAAAPAEDSGENADVAQPTLTRPAAGSSARLGASQ